VSGVNPWVLAISAGEKTENLWRGETGHLQPQLPFKKSLKGPDDDIRGGDRSPDTGDFNRQRDMRQSLGKKNYEKDQNGGGGNPKTLRWSFTLHSNLGGLKKGRSSNVTLDNIISRVWYPLQV